MRWTLALFVPTLAVVLMAVACGGDDEDIPGNDDLGGPLPPHMRSVSPGHGESVTSDDLMAGEDEFNVGICTGFMFQQGAGMGNEAPADVVRMTLNGSDVSADMGWVVTSDYPTSMGTGCYAPPESLGRGTHTVRVTYEDLTGQQFEYSWSFRVTG